MGWLRIRPSPSPTSSLNTRAASLPRPHRPKRGSSSIADSLTSFYFRRKTYSEGEIDSIDLVSLGPLSPSRVSRSNSPSELPKSEEVVLDHATPLPTPPASIHETPPSPIKIKNAVAFYESKASRCLAIQLPPPCHPSVTTNSPENSSPITPSPTYTRASEAEDELRKSVSEAEWPKSGSEDSMASLVSMLNEPPTNLCHPFDPFEVGIEPSSTPIHHESDCKPTLSKANMQTQTWLNSPRNRSTPEQKSESTTSLRTIDTNRKVEDDESSDIKPMVKTQLHSQISRSGHSRSWTVSEDDCSSAQSSEARSRKLFARLFHLSRRSQSRTSTEHDNTSVASLPCFMTSSEDFANHRAVQGLQMVTSEPSMAAFIDGYNSAKSSFSAEGQRQNSDADTTSVRTIGDGPITGQSPRAMPAQLSRPVSARSGLPISSRSFSKAPATSALSYFTRSPGMSISDMPIRQLVQIDETAALPSPIMPSPGSMPGSGLPSPDMPSPSFVDAMSFARDMPRTGSPASIGSSSRRHSMALVPVRMDSAVHFPRSVSPAWDMRSQSFSATIVDGPPSPLPLEPSTNVRVPVTVNPAATFPRSRSPPKDFSPVHAEAPSNKMLLEPTFSSRNTSDATDIPLYPMPIEPNFGRKRSNSKFEPNPDLQPISEVAQTSQKEVPPAEVSPMEVPQKEIPSKGVPQDGLPPAIKMGDGHRSTASYVYLDQPIPSSHPDTPHTEWHNPFKRLAKEDLDNDSKKDTGKENHKPNKLKKKKLHEKRHKLVRYSRRFILRRKVLNVLLGRQLGGAVADGLKAVTCLPVGAEGLDLAVVAVPGGARSEHHKLQQLHSEAMFPMAVVGRNELEREEKECGLRVVSTRSCVALTAPAPDLDDDENERSGRKISFGGRRRRSKDRRVSLEDLGATIRDVDYRSREKRNARVE